MQFNLTRFSSPPYDRLTATAAVHLGAFGRLEAAIRRRLAAAGGSLRSAWRARLAAAEARAGNDTINLSDAEAEELCWLWYSLPDDRGCFPPATFLAIRRNVRHD